MQESNSLPPVSIVIPSWNAAKFVERVLEALWAVDYPHFELVIIDNGVVNQETHDVVARWEALYHQRSCKLKLYQYQELLGYAGAVNEGVRLAEYDLVAINNNDNLPTRGWLKEIVRIWSIGKWQDKPIALVGAYASRSNVVRALGATNIWGRVVYFSEPMGAEPYPVLHPDGSSFLLDRRLVGIPYDREYFIYHEDVALGWRIWLEGMACIFVPKARADSFDGGTTRRLAYQTAFYSERNRLLNCLLYFELGTLVRLSGLLFVDLLVSFCFGSNKRARLDAWGSLLKNMGWVKAKRHEAQLRRKVPDRQLLKLFSQHYRSGSHPVIQFFISLHCRVWGLPISTKAPRDTL